MTPNAVNVRDKRALKDIRKTNIGKMDKISFKMNL